MSDQNTKHLDSSPPSSSPHWKYFLSLCEDVERLGRYIELTPANYSTYSIEVLRLLLATCAETDIVLKAICAGVAPSKKAERINEYRDLINYHFPGFRSTKVVARFGDQFLPWEEWDAKPSPAWWKAYNNVKHDRGNAYDQANVGNLVRALGGLCVALCHYQQLVLKELSATPFTHFIEIEDSTPHFPILRMRSPWIQPQLPGGPGHGAFAGL